MSKPKVLLLGDIGFAQETWEELSSLAELVKPQSNNRSDFLKECKSGSLDGVVAAYRTFFSISITGLWDEELVSALPNSFKLIAHNGAGYDQLTAIDKLSERGILASNVPTAVDDATADTAVFLLIGALRNFNTSILALRNGNWRGDPAPSYGHDPQGKTLGILGMGGIGRNLAKKCYAFGMKVVYHNRRQLDPSQEEGAKYVSFDELLGQSDVISLNVPLNQKTRHLLNKEAFGKMKKGVVIINTARGGVIDEGAMVEAINSGQVGSVGLDVYEEEPKVHQGLVDNPRVLLLPHMGTWTVETMTTMEQWCIGNVRRFLEGKDSWRKISVISEQHELLEKLLKES